MADPVRCPRDGATAVIEEHEGHHHRFKLDVCPRCRGVWFDAGEIGKLTGDQELERLIVAYAAGPDRMACPRCGARMAVRPVASVTIDVCTRCRGVWMDRGELEAAARALGHEAVRDPQPHHRARDLAEGTWTSPIAREALLEAAAREGFRPPS